MFDTGRLIFDDEFVSVLHDCIPDGSESVLPLILKNIDSDLAKEVELEISSKKNLTTLQCLNDDMRDLTHRAIALQKKHELYSKLSLAYGVQSTTELYSLYKESLRGVGSLFAPRFNSCERSGDSLRDIKNYLDNHLKIRGNDCILYNGLFEIVFKDKGGINLYESPQYREKLQEFCSQFENAFAEIYFIGDKKPVNIGQVHFNPTFDHFIGGASFIWDSVGASKAGELGAKKRYALMSYLAFLKNRQRQMFRNSVMKCVL